MIKHDPNSFYLSTKKVLGCFKDAVHGTIINAFIGLTPKMYAMDIQHDEEQQKAKGVPKQIVKNINEF